VHVCAYEFALGGGVLGVRGDRIVDGRHEALVAAGDETLERVLFRQTD
jgi:hypothetical protein